MKKTILSSLIASTFILGAAQAATAPGPFERLKTQGVVIDKEKPLNEHLDAVLLKDPRGGKILVFTDKSKQFIFQGTMMGPNLQPLNPQLEDEMNPLPTKAQIEEKLKDIKTVDTSKDNSLPVLYEFSETICPYCRKAHEYMEKKGYLDGKKVNVKTLPLVIHRGRNVEGQWSDVFNSDDPKSRLDAYYKGQLDNTNPKQDEKVTENLKKSQELASQLRINGTPGFFYFDENGKVKIIGGYSPIEIDKAVKYLTEKQAKKSLVKKPVVNATVSSSSANK